MKHNKLIDVIGTILLSIGFFLAFLPHAVHIVVGLDKETPHLKHVISGMTLVVLALGILIYNNKALMLPKKTTKRFILRR